MKRRCRRMLWFTRSFLKSTGELRGDPRGDPAGEAPGEGSMAPLRALRRAGGGPAPWAQRGDGDPSGGELLPAGEEQEARGCPSPRSPGKVSIPLPPAPGKLNNCLARAAGARSGPPPASRLAPSVPRVRLACRARGHPLAPRPGAPRCPRGGSCAQKGEDALPGRLRKRRAECRAPRPHGEAAEGGHTVRTRHGATEGQG